MSALIYECALPAVAESVRRARHQLDDALIGARVSGARRPDVAIVVSEAVTNVVVHAYPELEPGLLLVDASVTDGDLLVRVRDSGRGVGPRIDSPGLGVGLTLMARFADDLQITGNGSLAGTRVEALFRAVVPAGARAAAGRPPAEEFDDYLAALAAGRAWLADDLRAHARHALRDADRLRAQR